MILKVVMFYKKKNKRVILALRNVFFSLLFRSPDGGPGSSSLSSAPSSKSLAMEAME